MIDELLADLERDEGFVPHAYQDSLGFWTIGFGTLIDERRGGGISREFAHMLLERGAVRRWNDLCREKPFLVMLPEHVQRAVANMAYQLGVGGVLGFKNMLAALERFDFHTASREALASKWATQTPPRAERVAALMRGE